MRLTRNTVDFEEAASTANQKNTGAAIEALVFARKGGLL